MACRTQGGDLPVHRWPKAAMTGRSQGFTLIELLVVMTVTALLLSIALPKYFASVGATKEVVLRQNLQVVRHAIDRFRGDHGRYPLTLQQLVEARYLRQIPIDPLTESATTWKVVAPPNAAEQGVYDVKSGSDATGGDGTAVASW